MPDLKSRINRLAVNAKEAGRLLVAVDTNAINSALLAMAKKLDENRKIIQIENKKDLVKAKEKNLAPAMVDRLTLSDSVIDSMINGVTTVASLPTSIGKKYDERTPDNGLNIYKVKVPIGVIAMIFESRPNVTVDAAAICLKSNNAIILRGGSEAFHSNTILGKLFSETLKESGLPENSVQVLDTTDHDAVQYLLKESDNINLVIPRGGERLISTVTENSLIPVMKHYKGVCHTYIAESANVNDAIKIAVNAKVQRPGVCNAMETLIINHNFPYDAQKAIVAALLDEGVKLFGDDYIQKLDPRIEVATEDDWKAEYLDLRCAVKSVGSTDEAITHINRYNSGHTEAIVTSDETDKEIFRKLVDSSSVIINASTRFADGGEYGMGCEIGISTDKLHARGPMGVDDLTTYKWIVEGNGNIR